MNLKEFTNAEILYHEDLKNKVLIQVPNTKYHILCSYIKSNNTWTMHLVDLISGKRTSLATGATQELASFMIKKITEDGKSLSLKYTKTFKMFSQHLAKEINKKRNGKRR